MIFLAQAPREDVNFWRPSPNSSFSALRSGEPFLLKLKKPYYKVAGIGFFSHFAKLPLETAWKWFEERNGTDDYQALFHTLQTYREKNKKKPDSPSEIFTHQSEIGCIILSNPIFFDEEDWLPVPESIFSKNIVQGKTFNTSEAIGRKFWEEVENILDLYNVETQTRIQPSEKPIKKSRTRKIPLEKRYTTYQAKYRQGQGAFRTQVMDVYQKKCALTGERAMPVLEAAHIKPFAKEGPHDIQNGIFLRTDLHKMLDSGFWTLNDDFTVRVSPRIEKEFGDNCLYKTFEGQLLEVPKDKDLQPASEYIRWHRENQFYH